MCIYIVIPREVSGVLINELEYQTIDESLGASFSQDKKYGKLYYIEKEEAREYNNDRIPLHTNDTPSDYVIQQCKRLIGYLRKCDELHEYVIRIIVHWGGEENIHKQVGLSHKLNKGLNDKSIEVGCISTSGNSGRRRQYDDLIKAVTEKKQDDVYKALKECLITPQELNEYLAIEFLNDIHLALQHYLISRFLKDDKDIDNKQETLRTCVKKFDTEFKGFPWSESIDTIRTEIDIWLDGVRQLI